MEWINVWDHFVSQQGVQIRILTKENWSLEYVCDADVEEPTVCTSQTAKFHQVSSPALGACP